MSSKGFLLGPFLRDDLPFETVHLAPLLQFFKPDFKRRIVCDLSHPKYGGVSVNDCIGHTLHLWNYVNLF